MIVSTQMPPWGVANLPCNRPRMPGISLSRPMAYVMRTPVLRQARVVPTRARRTVAAMIMASTLPVPPSILSPMVLIMSPAGDPLTAAAAPAVAHPEDARHDAEGDQGGDLDHVDHDRRGGRAADTPEGDVAGQEGEEAGDEREFEIAQRLATGDRGVDVAGQRRGEGHH